MADIMTHQFNEFGDDHPRQQGRESCYSQIGIPLLRANNVGVDDETIAEKSPLKQGSLVHSVGAPGL